MTIGMIERRIKNKCSYYENEFFKTNKGIAVKVLNEYPRYNDSLCYSMDFKNLLYLLLIENNSYSSSFDSMLDMFSKCTITDFKFICELYTDDPRLKKDILKFKEKDIEAIIACVGDTDTINKDIFRYVIRNFQTLDKIFSSIDFELFVEIIHMRYMYDIVTESKKLPSVIRKDKVFTKKYIGKKADVEMVSRRLNELIEMATKKSGSITVRGIDSKIKLYRKLLKSLEQEEKKDEIVESIGYAERIDDDSIKDDVFNYIYEHNSIYWEKLEKEYIEKNSNSINSFIEFFNTQGLDFRSLSDSLKKKIMEDSIDIVKEKVRVIKRFADNKQLFNVLVNSSLDNLLLINMYLNKQYINSNFLSNNIEVLLNSDLFDNLKNNIEFLENEINFKRYDDLSFLLVDNSIIRTNINLLNKYGIPFKNSRDLSFIKNSVIDKLCTFIEVGLESIIMSNPDILNIDVDLAKRVLLTKEIGEDVIIDGELDSLVIYKDSFFANEKEVKEFALTRDNSLYNGDDELYLSNMDSTPLSYIVDGVIVPKMRIKNQPVMIKDIVRQSLYSEEQIKTLEKNSIK